MAPDKNRSTAASTPLVFASSSASPSPDPAVTPSAIARPIILHAGLYAGSAALLKLAGFVFFLWLARTLSVPDYGAWGLYYALQTAVTTFSLVGIVEALVGLLKTHATPERQRHLYATANSVFFAVAAISVVVVSLLFLGFAGLRPGSAANIIWVLLSGGMLAYASLQAQIVRLQERHLSSLWFNFLVPLTGLAGSVAGVAYQKSIAAYFIGSTIGLGLSLGGGAICGIGFYPISKVVGDWRPILVRITPFIAVTFLGWLSGYGNNYVTKLLFDSTAVAKFTLTFMLSGLMQLVASAMNMVWSPRFYRMTHDRPFAIVEAQNRRFFFWQGVTLGLVGCSLIALYPLAMKILGGNLVHYQTMRFELLWLILAYIASTPAWQCQNYFLAYDKGSSMLKMHLATSAIGIATLFVLLKVFGALGIYLGFFAQMALRSVGSAMVAKRYWAVQLSWGGMGIGSLLAVIGFLAAARVAEFASP